MSKTMKKPKSELTAIPSDGLNSYIGKAWKENAYGPDEFDCWGLVAHIYKTHFNIDLPNFDVVPYTRRNAVLHLTDGKTDLVNDGTFRQVNQLKAYDIVMLEQQGMCMHVGIYVHGKVMHVSRFSNGCVLESVAAFRRKGTNMFAYRCNKL